MRRRDFIQQASAWLGAPVPGGRRPNLLFVFSDQQSSDTLGCYGNRQAVTPNLDRFAAQAVRFNHCISNSPLCTPYRGLLLSGQHSLFNGALENDVRMLPGRGKYFGEVLRDAGYRTGYVGKWHLYGGNRNRPIPPGPDRYGFDHTFLSNNCTVIFDAERAYYWNPEGRKTLYGDWEPYAQARQAMQFIDENADRPWALFVSWHPPHNWSGIGPRTGPEDGYGAPEDLRRLYDPQALRLRGNCADSPSARKLYQGYLAMCTSIDRAFGWLTDKLEEKGLAGDTLVVFTSDHGDTALSHGLLANKMRPEAESIRVPLLLRYPGRLTPRASNLLVGTLDLMPTLLGLLGLRKPDTCHGRDLTAAIVNRRDNEVDAVPLFLFALDWRGLYTRRYTYAFDTNAGRACRYRSVMFSRPAGLVWNCLYDREADPWELRNLYASPEHQKLRARLHEQALAAMRRFGDKGLPYERVQEAALSPADLELVRDQTRMRVTSGVLKGRPVDLL
jgi:arylsulfatase A-like enzyme